MHIIIGGFGRSGTTWLSDIISKSLGGLVLFEPFHPAVFSSSEELIYAENIDNDLIRSHLTFLYEQSPSNPWILRNHLNSPLESHSSAFMNYVWKNSRILGFKTIRGNHILDHLSMVGDGSKVVYIYRHPLAVLNSINKRMRFWEELGWTTHKRIFFERALATSSLDHHALGSLREIISEIRSKNENIIAMWSISLMISLNKVEKANGHLISYEQLYEDPYKEVGRLLDYLEVKEKSTHPSYFFTPSMTSLRTLHHLRKHKESEFSMDQLFWIGDIGEEEAQSLKTLCQRILQYSRKAFDLARRNNYL